MDRFFGRIDAGVAEISGEEFHHLFKVMRKRVGDRVGVFDGRREFVGEIAEISPREGRAVVRLNRELPPMLPPVHITVAVSPPKGGRLDELISRLVEIGVSAIVPMLCERTVRRPKKRKDRWGRIVLSAVKQSRRTDIPEVLPPMSLPDVLEAFGDYEGKFAGLIGSETPLVRLEPRPRNVILIGPEGDFTPREREMILKAGFVGFSMGKIILRVETAAMVSAACLLQKAWANAPSS
ncbi:MAG: 16S rRNA (uracil(1498)-N(3))-methyltransferase [Thermotogae bacterium]|nr:16S rRNA (uracil(1498)-N(3))-methyltransferase [Thermotogota bacterium]